MGKKITSEEILVNFKKVHGDRYDYSLVKDFIESNNYNGVKTKLPIICREHGLFFQDYGHHYNRKHGCPKCAKNGVKYTFEEYKKKIKSIFGDDIIVLSNDYKNSHTKMKFLCKKHGEFETKPYYLLQNHGCPLCGSEKTGDAIRLTQEQFIEKARVVHGNKYDYNKSVYIDYETSLTIICHKKNRKGVEHGEFQQTPHSHLHGCGCQICNRSHLEREIADILDNENIKYEEQKRFLWLGLMEVDFYLPDYDLVIECQGEQHYVPCNFGSKEKTPEEMFKYVKERDEKKKRALEEHGLDVIYYTHYVEENENTFNTKENLKKYLEKRDRIKQDLQL